MRPVPPLHLGPLHADETALILGLAFGPFLLVAVVVLGMRRRADREARETGAASDESRRDGSWRRG